MSLGLSFLMTLLCCCFAIVSQAQPYSAEDGHLVITLEPEGQLMAPEKNYTTSDNGRPWKHTVSAAGPGVTAGKKNDTAFIEYIVIDDISALNRITVQFKAPPGKFYKFQEGAVIEFNFYAQAKTFDCNSTLLAEAQVFRFGQGCDSAAPNGGVEVYFDDSTMARCGTGDLTLEVLHDPPSSSIRYQGKYMVSADVEVPSVQFTAALRETQSGSFLHDEVSEEPYQIPSAFGANPITYIVDQSRINVGAMHVTLVDAGSAAGTGETGCGWECCLYEGWKINERFCVRPECESESGSGSGSGSGCEDDRYEDCWEGDCAGNGEECCESQGFSLAECSMVGCCDWDEGQCWSAVGTDACSTGGGPYDPYDGSQCIPEFTCGEGWGTGSHCERLRGSGSGWGCGEGSGSGNNCAGSDGSLGLKVQFFCPDYSGIFCSDGSGRSSGSGTGSGSGCGSSSTTTPAGDCANGEECCECKGFSLAECSMVGCCDWDEGQCWSAVGTDACSTGGGPGNNHITTNHAPTTSSSSTTSTPPPNTSFSTTATTYIAEVKFSFKLAMTMTEFDNQKATLEETIADVAGVESNQVTATAKESARRASHGGDGSLDVDVVIKVEDTAAAKALSASDKLKAASLTEAMADAGLPEPTELSKPTVAATTELSEPTVATTPSSPTTSGCPHSAVAGVVSWLLAAVVPFLALSRAGGTRGGA